MNMGAVVMCFIQAGFTSSGLRAVSRILKRRGGHEVLVDF